MHGETIKIITLRI